MKAIKFRIWRLDKEEWENGIVMNSHTGELCTNHNEDFLVLQFTGLKDRNGKDIYEGDILRLTSVDLQDENLPPIVGHVVWDDDNARFIMRDTKSPHIHSVSSTYAPRLEALGNAYENPELLR
jgi:uncharacterized phage protein (TIGR01671 family)